MLTVTFDGVEFTKASHVAKQFGYTSDYLGQLCRAKKVNARLVGRTWFINVPSLESHRERKYTKIKVSSKDKDSLPVEIETSETDSKSDKPSKNYLRRVPPPHVATRKILQVADKEGVMRHASVRYEEDDQSLIPKVANKPKVTLLRVDMADSESLPVKSTEKANNVLKPEPLPAVSLSGSLIVSAIPDEEVSTDAEENSAKSKEAEISDKKHAEKSEQKPVVNVIKKHSSTRDKSKNKLKIEEVESLKSETIILKTSKRDDITKNTKESNTDKVPKTSPEKTTFEQKLISVAENSQPSSHEVPVRGENPVQVVRISYQLPVLATLAGLVIAVLVLSAEHVAFVSLEVVDFTLSFDWKKVANMALVLFTG